MFFLLTFILTPIKLIDSLNALEEILNRWDRKRDLFKQLESVPIGRPGSRKEFHDETFIMGPPHCPYRFFGYAWDISEAYFFQIYLNGNRGYIPDISHKLYLESKLQVYLRSIFQFFCFFGGAFKFCCFLFVCGCLCIRKLKCDCEFCLSATISCGDQPVTPRELEIDCR